MILRKKKDNFMKERYIEGATRMAKLILERRDELKSKDGAALVFPHSSVDGDCVGSACAVASVLRFLGVSAWVSMPEELPDNMSFLGVEDLLFYPTEEFTCGDLLINGKHYDLAFSVDCSEGHRMGDNNCKLFELYDDALDIDHHEVLHLSSDLKWIDPGSSSACEMVWYVLVKISELIGKPVSEVVDVRTAKCLMAGIVTDTGRFTYTNTKPETLEAAGALMDLGGNITEVCYNLFDMKTPEEFSITSAACYEARFCLDGKLALAVVPEQMFRKYNAGKDALAGVAEKLRDVGGVEFSCVLREIDGSIRANLRSKSEFDCSEFAEKYGGGGHKRAAGFRVTGRDINDLAGEIISEASKYL